MVCTPTALASPESLLEMLNLRSHPRSTDLLSRFLARSPRDLSAHQSIGSCSTDVDSHCPLAMCQPLISSVQSFTNFRPMWVAACWTPVRWVRPTQHGLQNSSSCLSLQLIFLPFSFQRLVQPALLQARKLLFVLSFCIKSIKSCWSFLFFLNFLSLVSPFFFLLHLP